MARPKAKSNSKPEPEADAGSESESNESRVQSGWLQAPRRNSIALFTAMGLLVTWMILMSILAILVNGTR